MSMIALRQRCVAPLLSAAAAITVAIGSQPVAAVGPDALQPVPRASCGPNDHIESVQGQTTLAERFAPGPSRAYNCNLELVGQFEGEGASAGLDALGNCAYFSTNKNTDTRHPGLAVVDVSNPKSPTALAYLKTEGMLGAFESVAVSERRKLLIASKMSFTDPAPFDMYDISDCRHPVLKSSTTFPGLYSHAGQFTADGRIYYGSKWIPDAKSAPHAAVFAVDVSDPAKPRLIATWVPEGKDWSTHSVVVNRDATRAYVSIKRTQDDREKASNPNGLAVLDLTEIKAGRAKPEIRLLSTLFWHDTHASEGMQWFTVGSQPYLVFADNLGAIGVVNPVPPDACEYSAPSHGFARLIDLADERNPKTVSKLMLESAAPANCSKVIHDPTTYGAYGSFACSVDREENARLLACAYFEAGLRVFDIRDPVHPVEVAYYKPPARRTQKRPGSLFYYIEPKTGLPADQTADSVITFPKFRGKGQDIWFTSVGNGFQVVRFSERFKKSHSALFADEFRIGTGDLN